jgi:hypothetical protein
MHLLLHVVDRERVRQGLERGSAGRYIADNVGADRNRSAVSLFHPEMPTIPRLLEAAWAHAFPGREAAERNAVLRELSQLQQ